MVVGGSKLAYEFFIFLPKGSTLADLPSLDSSYTWALSSFMISYFTIDLIIGIFAYPTQIGFVSGWIHHLAYGYCVFAVLQRGQAGGFIMVASLLEWPTIFLSLGHMNKKWRQDLVFGAL
jgi:hypothetical protein